MKALVLTDYNKFEYQEMPDPQLAPDDVLVAVKACGICGSDVHGMDGSTGRRRPPIIMGHEAAGVISKIGSTTSGWSVGDPVTFDSTVYCGQCTFCRQGLINLCDNRRVLGVSCAEYRQNGAMAEFVAVPQHILYRLPNGLPFEKAALIEPFAIALHAVRRAAPSSGSRVAVIGAGMIGLALVQALSQAGCERTIVVDVAADRLAMAHKMGATHIVDSASENALEKLQEFTEQQGADAVFEAVGLPVTVDLALRSARKGGSVVLVGNVAPKVEFPLQIAVTRELSIFGSCASRGEYPACLEMMASGSLRPDPLISAAAPLSEGASWFDRLHRKEPGLLKVIMKP